MSIGSEPDSKAKSYAMWLLSMRSYTEKALYDKICTKYEPELAASAVARMIELGLLNDEDYATRYAADLYKFKRYSNRRISLELKRKGIDENIVENVVAELNDDPEPQIAKTILKKYKKYICTDEYDEKGRNKTINSLVRLGFRFDDIKNVIRNLSDDETYYDDWET